MNKRIIMQTFSAIIRPDDQGFPSSRCFEECLESLDLSSKVCRAEFPFLRFGARFVNFQPLNYELQDFKSRRLALTIAHARH